MRGARRHLAPVERRTPLPATPRSVSSRPGRRFRTLRPRCRSMGAGQAAEKLLRSPIAGRTGVGWMVHFVPFHRSAAPVDSGRWSCGLVAAPPARRSYRPGTMCAGGFRPERSQPCRHPDVRLVPLPGRTGVAGSGRGPAGAQIAPVSTRLGGRRLAEYQAHHVYAPPARRAWCHVLELQPTV